MSTSSGRRKMHTLREFKCGELTPGHALELLCSNSLSQYKVPKLSGKPLWLYGNGALGALACEFFSAVGVSAKGPFEYDQTAPIDAQIAVCIVTSPYVPIEQKLAARGFTDIVPFYDLAYELRGHHPLANGWAAFPLEPRSKDNILTVMSGWGDDISLAHYTQFLAWRMWREEWAFDGAPVYKGNQFFIDEIIYALRDNESFLDGGAYCGEYSRKFINLVGGNYKEVIAIEPDPKSFNRLQSLLNSKKIVLAQYALDHGNYKCRRFAATGGLTSRISGDGNIFVPAVSIDDLDVVPTFIKLHLEGGEFNALYGAQDTLFNYRPMLAVSVDHNVDGIYRTALWLMDRLEGYKILFRNHCWCGDAAVIYAIPNERAK